MTNGLALISSVHLRRSVRALIRKYQQTLEARSQRIYRTTSLVTIHKPPTQQFTHPLHVVAVSKGAIKTSVKMSAWYADVRLAIRTYPLHSARFLYVDFVFFSQLFFISELEAVVSWLRGQRAIALLPPKIIGLTENCRNVFSLSKHFCPEIQILRLKLFVSGNLRTKLRFWAPIISSVTDLQLSVKILWEIFSVCLKIVSSCSDYFL